MENKEMIQDTVKDVMENVNPSLIDKVLGNPKVIDGFTTTGVVGGNVVIVYFVIKGIKKYAPKVIDGTKNLCGKIFGKKTPVADPVQDLTEVVDQATEA